MALFRLIILGEDEGGEDKGEDAVQDRTVL